MSLKVEIIKTTKEIKIIDSRTKEIIKIVFPQEIQIGASNVNKNLTIFGNVSSHKGSFSQGISGSLTQLPDGTSYIVNGSPGALTITSQSNGSIIFSASGGGGGGAPYDAQYLTLALNSSLANERTFAAGTGLSITDEGANGRFIVKADSTVVFLTASQTLENKVLASPTINSPTINSPNFGANNITTTGVGTFSSGISGSLTRLADGTSYIINASPGSLSITTQSNGSIVLSASGGGGSSFSGADREASFILVGTTSSLPNERSLSVGSGLALTDLGAGNNIGIGINNNIIATITGSTFTQLSGSLQRTAAGISYLQGVGGILVTSQSNGQIFISSSLGNFAPISPSYVTLATDATLSSERVLTAGGGITITDGGAGANVTLGINNNLIATITGSTFAQLSGSLQMINATTPYLLSQGSITITTQSNGQIIISGSAGNDAPITAQYLTLATDATLQNERVLTQGSGITITDAGAGSTATLGINNNLIATITGSTFAQLSGSLQRTSEGISYLVAQGSVTITTQSNGQIIISGSGAGGGGGGAPTTAQYLTLTTDATLSDERVLTQGSGITITDGGAGSTATLGINNNLIATITGSTFTQLSGSLQRTSAGLSYLQGVGAITVTSQSNGQILISASLGNFAPTTPSYVTLATDATLASERVLTAGGGVTITDGGAGGNITLGINNNLIATITGSTFAQLSGSLQMINSTLPYLISQGSITITTQSNGQIIISGSGAGGGGSGAPTTAQYLTLATDATLTAERVLTQGSGITITDGGAGAAATLGINNGLIATITGSTFTQLSGSLQRTGAGLSYLVSGGTVTVTSQSNGQIIISGSGAGGLSTQFQINNASVFSGSGQFIYDTAANRAVAGAQGFEVSNPAGTFGTVFRSAAVAADRVITFPLLTADDTAVTAAFTQTLTNKTLNTGTTGSSIQLRTRLDFNNPANTFAYQITPGAIAANRILNLPVITATDTLVVTTLAQTLANKTLTSPVINTPNFGANDITTTGTGTFSAGVIAGKVRFTSEDNTATGTINDLAIASTTSLITFSGAGPLILTGIAGGADGQVVYLINRSGSTLTMNHESASSTAANRFSNAYSTDHIIQDGVGVIMIYSATSSRWHPAISF